MPRKIVRKNGQVAKVKETILKPGTDRYGYSFVVLCKDRTKRTTAIHRLVAAADVLEDYELDYIRHVIKPKPKECYRNSHLLCEAFPERILYCEGKTNVPIPIDHAFNKVGDAYIDITFEFALHENPSIYEYVTFGEYDAKTIRKAVLETGYYGEIYKWLYYQSKK